MKIAIHPDKTSSGSYSQKWSEFLNNMNIEVKWVDLTSLNALGQVKSCDGVMWRWIHIPHDKIKAHRILYTIEHHLLMPVFPNHNTCWHYDDKVAQHYMLRAENMPMPKTWVFWSKNTALKWAKKTKYPKIFKLSAGASSSNVIKISSAAEASKLIERMFDHGIFPMTMNEYKPRIIPRNCSQLRESFYRIKHGLSYGLTSLYPPMPSTWWQPEKDYAYFQEFIPNNMYDTRVTVIGNRAFCYRRFNRPDDFRASGSGNFDINPSKNDLNCVKIAFNVSKKFKFQSMAYDFIFKDKNPLIVEISYTFVDWMVHKCPGHWNSDLDWIEGNMWPEDAQVEDFIKYVQEFKKK